LALRPVLDALEDAFGQPLHLVHLETGERLETAASLPTCDGVASPEMLAAVARSNRPQLISDDDAIGVLALPLHAACDLPYVAYAPFVTRAVGMWGVSHRTAAMLGLSGDATRKWIEAQPVWPAEALQRLAQELLRRLQTERRAERLEEEIEQATRQLSASYEEISLLHALSQNFRLSQSDEALGSLALEWLLDCMPVRGVALLYLPSGGAQMPFRSRSEPLLLTRGASYFRDSEAILNLMAALNVPEAGQPLVVSRAAGAAKQLPGNIDQLIAAPLVEGARLFGYLVAIDHLGSGEFGSVEANLLASVSAMLGVHCSNRDLYRQQDEFVASVVRALTSAIDAKDPYTCGHSDRVARIARRLAEQLGCDSEFLNTIYMAGLLHDIGKIGVDDAILRKPGKLDPAELEHIKRHPGLGYKILADIKQFGSVLPAVLHHHEQWDGRGYPCGLAGEQIPYMARILAVADAYDAMTSDRPYRRGLPTAKVLNIFLEGAGQQWDAEVVEALLAIHDELGVTVYDRSVQYAASESLAAV
jgi:putative nucleotidyltransferase with HDIG domain